MAKCGFHATHASSKRDVQSVSQHSFVTEYSEIMAGEQYGS
jgi:hypothetical protein